MTDGGTHHAGTWPRVTIVIPLYNVERYVGAAIESVLAQTLPADQLEIVVVNDGSTDGSADVVERYVPRVRHLRQENRGLAAARNVGLHAARGEFVGFLDADDRLLPEKLAAQLAVFDARPQVGVVYTGLVYIDETGRPLPQTGWARLPLHPVADFVLSNRVAPHLPLVRRADVERVGAFDESMSPAADWDVWLRLARAGLEWVCVDRALAEYRVRPDAMHGDVDAMHVDCLRVLDKFFADRTLPADILALRSRAYQRRHLVAACEHWARGDAAAGARCFRAAADADERFLTDPVALAQACRWMLPLGRQGGAPLVAEVPRLATTLRRALDELFAVPHLPPRIARLRWRAHLAAYRALAPFARRWARDALRRRWARLRDRDAVVE